MGGSEVEVVRLPGATAGALVGDVQPEVGSGLLGGGPVAVCGSDGPLQFDNEGGS